MKDQLQKSWEERCELRKKALMCFQEVKRLNQQIERLNPDDGYSEMVELSDRGLSLFKTGQDLRDSADLQWEASVAASGRKIKFWQKPDLKEYSWDCILDDGREFKA